MTPKEKAEKLVNSFYLKFIDRYDKSSMNEYESKHCALIAVDEILKVVSFYNDSQAEVIYFKEVKQEIEKL